MEIPPPKSQKSSEALAFATFSTVSTIGGCHLDVFRSKLDALDYVHEIPEAGFPFCFPFSPSEILQDIANQQGVSGGLFTPDQSFINLTKKGILTFYPYW